MTTFSIPIRTPYDDRGYFSVPWAKWFQAVQNTLDTSPRFVQGAHADRLNTNAAAYADGTLYAETDRVLMYVAIGKTWVYLAGVLQATQQTLPEDLGAGDYGLLCWVTDYNHLLRWTGSAWSWAPGELGSDFMMAFNEAPADGWHACDGSTVNRLNADGSVSEVKLPVSTNYYRI